MTFKMILLWCVPLAAGVLLSLSTVDEAVSAVQPGDDQVVARVNGVTITKGQVRTRVEIYELAHPGLAPSEARVRRAGIAVQVLIYGALEEQLARELGVSVTEAEVEAQYATVRGRQDDQTFVNYLRMQGNDPAHLRRDLRRGLISERVKKKLSDAIVVTQQDLQAKFEEEKVGMFPEQVKASQIIVLTEDLARQLYGQLKEGADFARLAQSTSTESSSRENGGDLGWVLRGTGHYPPWDNIVFKMKPGEISEPFQTVHGWHIVKVEVHRAVGWGRAEDKRELLTTLVKEQRSTREVQRRLEELKKRADLWILPRIELDASESSINLLKK